MRAADRELMAWIRQQIDADQRVALNVRESQRQWSTAGGWPEYGPDTVVAAGGTVAEELDEADARHIARWDPARALRQVEVNRQILDWAEEWLEREVAPWNTDLIRMVGLQFADRAGYREEWRP
jgi:hypothetical protein